MNVIFNPEKISSVKQVTGVPDALPIDISFIEASQQDQDESMMDEGLFWKNKMLPNIIENVAIFSICKAVEMTTKSGNHDQDNDADVQRVYLARIKRIEGKPFNVQPGQSFGIVPPQSVDLVMAFLNRIKVKDPYDQVRILSDNNNGIFNSKIPSATIMELFLKGKVTLSMLQLFTFVLDLYSFPKKSMLRTLADYCPNSSIDRKYLYYLSSKEGSNEYRSIMSSLKGLEKRASMLDWLTSFPSCNPPCHLFIEHLPLIKPRYYSTTCRENGYLEFCFNVQPSGICSIWLETKILSFLQNNSENLHCFERPSNMQTIGLYVSLTENAFSRPWVMISTGTGIGPMISLIDSKLDNNTDIWLVYGCRYRKRDFLFKNRLIEWGFREDCDGSHTMNVICSRDSKTESKRYVQHLLMEKKDQLLDWIINRDATIFVCGNRLGMLQGVHDMFIKILSTTGLDDPKKILLEWSNVGKYRKEIWNS